MTESIRTLDSVITTCTPKTAPTTACDWVSQIVDPRSDSSSSRYSTELIHHTRNAAIGASIVKRTVVWHAMLEELLDTIVGSSA